MRNTLIFFLPSLLVTIAGLALVFVVGGGTAVVLAFLLITLEITLSFDNAVVNARVLERMSPRWQRRFLTWGTLIAVFGARTLFPIGIVSATTWISPFVVAKLALFDSETYGRMLENAHYSINAFGAAFLLLVALKYFMDASKERHWLHFIERHLSRWGRVESVEITIALTVLVVMAFLVPAAEMPTVLVAGLVGVILFLLTQGIMSLFSFSTEHATSGGLALFVYLNILDTAFSLDSVVGAFAIATSLVVIGVGLGVGAFFVRSLTVYLVREHALQSLVYLEHGAHWAILGLSFSMLAALLFNVPDIITGSIGLLFVLAAYYSSLIFNRRKASLTS